MHTILDGFRNNSFIFTESPFILNKSLLNFLKFSWCLMFLWCALQKIKPSRNIFQIYNSKTNFMPVHTSFILSKHFLSPDRGTLEIVTTCYPDRGNRKCMTTWKPQSEGLWLDVIEFRTIRFLPFFTTSLSKVS